jgi:hypothetical protein
MKNIWKWILGVVLVLVVVAGLVGVTFVIQTRLGANFTQRAFPAAQAIAPNSDGKTPAVQGQAPAQYPGPDFRNGRSPMRGGFRGERQPMMGGRGAGFLPFHGGMPFGLGFMILGGLMRLIPLVLLGLLFYFAYWLGKRSNVVSPVAAPPAPVSAPAHACAKCGESVQDDWNHCPNCGKKQ